MLRRRRTRVPNCLLTRKEASVYDKNIFDEILLQDVETYENYLKINTFEVSISLNSRKLLLDLH